MDRPSPKSYVRTWLSRFRAKPCNSARANIRFKSLLALALLATALAGCSAPKWVTVRDAPHNPLSERLMLLSRGGPQPTERTNIFLRRYDLEGHVRDNPRKVVQKVQGVIDRDPSPEAISAAAELAYIGGVRTQLTGLNASQALDLYSSSVAYSYTYLFEPDFAKFQNPYDPQFRGACDLYNAALEAALRAVKKQDKLHSGATFTVEVKGQPWDVTVTPKNVPWPADEIERFEFVSDYEIHGLKNVFHTYGLGVPLIAVRKQRPESDPMEKHYAPGLSFPVTAFLRCVPDEPRVAAASKTEGPARRRAVLELYDPLQTTDVTTATCRVPLESDLTTPLAYALNDPAFAKLDQPTTGLLFPDRVKQLAGIYMLEPYQPDKIPVLMVHGLWSSPITWMEMFNDLRGDPNLRRDYQFWFYLYPTGQPFWRSATQLREALAELRTTVDPGRQAPALDQMVLVGHSMGGLIANMQVVNSRDDFWRIVSDQPISLVKSDEKTRRMLDQLFYFKANASVRRIVTIGTPHMGSYFANDTTRYLGQKLISVPERMTARFAQLRMENPGFFRDTQMLDTATSLDSLSPTSPVLPVLVSAQMPPWIRYHNIVGRLPKEDWQVRLFGEGDGVVPYKSGHLEHADSQIDVPAEHSAIHRHPQTILQVRAVLTRHLQDLEQNYPRVERKPEERTAAAWR